MFDHENQKSKIKRVFIELHDYTFCHGPSDNNNSSENDHFVGRERLIEKVKNIIRDTSKRSGNYLVTGYRGMGKTSFVNKVVDSVTSKHLLSRYVSKIFLVSLINYIFLLTVVYLIPKGEKYNYTLILPYFWASIFIISLFLKFINPISKDSVDLDIITSHKTRFLISNIGICISFSNLLLELFAIRNNPNFGHWWFYVFFAMVAIMQTISFQKRKLRFRFNWSHVKNKFSIDNYINDSRRIVIKLNLGYSNLKEVDILRLISRQIQIEYSKHSRLFTFSKLIRASYKFAILVLVLFIFHSPIVKNYRLNFLVHSNIASILPSQNFILNSLKRELSTKQEDSINQKNPENTIKKLPADTLIPIAKDVTNGINISSFSERQSIVINQSGSGAIENKYKVGDKSKLKDFLKSTDELLESSYASIYDYLPFPLQRGFFLPHTMDYFFFIFMLLVMGSIIFADLFFSRQRQVLQKIKFINNRIDSNITREAGLSASLSSKFTGFQFKRSQEYPRADEREIEKRLIEIIDDLDHLPVYRHPVNFLFIFDELDKIEPPLTTEEKSGSQNLHGSQDIIRRRQQTIMELLSNLKYFLSTAKSKFIFIAGREMYDASLADISDRNFRIGSIFHDVFYLESFFSDLNMIGFDDITSRTEQFVCQYLIPKDFIKEKKKEEIAKIIPDSEHTNHSKALEKEFKVQKKIIENKKSSEYQTIHYYNKYLIEKYPTEFGENIEKDNEKNAENRIKREKVITLLQQFITYLNMVSTGAPSKLIIYFENFITNTTDESVYKFKDAFVAGKKRQGPQHFYLSFDYYDQYKIGLCNYLMTPFNVTINKNIKNFSDKLIVSAAFLHAHMYKFHRNAFSWRDLEATPEMVDLNKSPEIRDFLKKLIRFMLNMQIQPIVNGLYDYKFPKRLAQEIAFLSHIDDESSANFNFTLDESQAVKQHFKEQYRRLENLMKSGDTNDKKYIFSQSSLHLSLADMSYYDEDLGEAIMYYNETMRKLRENVESISLTQLVLLIRDMLKLGLALEKRHTYEVAFLTYSEISAEVKKRIKGAYELNAPNKEQFLVLLENVKFFYQPIIAQLYLIEKKSNSGATAKDIEKAASSFQLITKYSSKESVQWLKSDFCNKIGDLLYYQNKKMDRDCKSKIQCEAGNDCKSEKNCSSKTGSCVCPLKAYPVQRDFSEISNYSSCYWYYIAIETLLGRTNNAQPQIEFIWEQFINSELDDSSKLSSLAMLVSDTGDTFASCDKIRTDQYKDINSLIEKNKPIDDKFKERAEMLSLFMNIDKSPVVIPLFYCYLAALLFEKAGEYNDASYQYTKMLYLIREELYWLSKKEGDYFGVYSDLADLVFRKATQNKFKAHEAVNMYEIDRNKAIFHCDEKPKPAKISLNTLSLNTEIDEISVLALEIKMKLKPNDSYSEQIFRLVNPYSLHSNMYGRFLKLRTKSIYNKNKFFKTLGEVCCRKEIKKRFSPNFEYLNVNNNSIIFLVCAINKLQQEKLKELKKLIADSIFCLFEITKIFNTFEYTYQINHSTLGETHEELYYWSIVYNELLRLEDGKEPESLKQILSDLIEADNIPFISKHYQRQKAILEYKAALETHNQGTAYRNLIDNLYYLNDDFNDNSFHFTIALERFKLKEIKERLILLEKRENEQRLYNHDNYLGTEKMDRNNKPK